MRYHTCRKNYSFSNLYLHDQKFILQVFSLSFPIKDLQPFAKVIVHWSSEITRLLGISKHWL